MGSRSSHVRTKVVALIVSLVALWAFAAYVTLRDGLDLLFIGTLDRKVSQPPHALVTALQEERRLSLVYLSGHTPQQRAALDGQRARTDAARTRFETASRASDARLAANGTVTQRVDDAFTTLKGLIAGREAIDAGIVSRADAAATFTDVIDAGFQIYASLSSLDDPQLANENRVLAELTRAREVLAQEDALLAGMLAAGRFTDSEHAQFDGYVSTQRFLYAEAAANLPAPDAARYQQVVAGPAVRALRSLENQVVARNTAPLPVTADGWQAAVAAAIDDLHGMERAATAGTLDRAGPRATLVVLRLILAGGLGPLAVI